MSGRPQGPGTGVVWWSGGMVRSRGMEIVGGAAWDIPSRCCFFTGPWTVTRPSLRMLRRVAAFCRPLRPVLLPVLFPRSRSPVVGVPGLCWMCPPPPHTHIMTKFGRPISANSHHF